MQLNGFDNFILKIPNTATNVFTEKDKEDLGAWFYILTIANYIFPLISTIVALILRKKKGAIRGWSHDQRCGLLSLHETAVISGGTGKDQCQGESGKEQDFAGWMKCCVWHKYLHS